MALKGRPRRLGGVQRGDGTLKVNALADAQM